VVAVPAIRSGASRHTASAVPIPNWPMLCAASSTTTAMPNTPSSAGPIRRASTRPIRSVPKRADAASMKTQPMAWPIRLASGLLGRWLPGEGRGNPYTAWPSGCQVTPPYSGRWPSPPGSPLLAAPPEPLTAGTSADAPPADGGGPAVSVTVGEPRPARPG
jgi:hypothetical protein